MSLRLLPLLFLLSALCAAPAFAIGPAVAGAGSGHASVGAVTPSGSGGNVASAEAHSGAADRSCSASLRGFRGRNTLQPSVRRAALDRCEADRAATDWSAAAR